MEREPSPERRRAFRILVVDDDRGSLGLLGDWLTREGYEVEPVTSGSEALARLARERPDAMLLDLLLPVVDGLELLRQIKASPLTADLPVVVMTVKRDVRDKVECLNSGADGFIVKPFHFDELDAVLRSCLRRRARTSPQYEDTIRELERAKAELERLTITDERTGLVNDRYLKRRLSEEFEAFERYGSPLSVAMFDLDHFKRVNDDYGHDCGDLVLASFAKLLAANARGIDIVGRFGGEEFLMILRNTDSIRAAIVGERIRKAESENVVLYGETSLRVTVSAGIASVPTNARVRTEADLVKAADDALRRAKQSSRNRVLVDPASMPREILEGDLTSIFKASYEDSLSRRREPEES